MVFERKILVPLDLRENRSQETPPPPVKKILKSKDHSYNKWIQFRLHQHPYFETQKQKTGTHSHYRKLVLKRN